MRRPWLRRTFDHVVQLHADGSARLITTLTIANTEPAGSSGNTLNVDSLSYITLYGPQGAVLAQGSDTPNAREPAIAGHPASGWLRTALPLGQTVVPTIVVIGQGYVSCLWPCGWWKSAIDVVGYEPDEARTKRLVAGESYVKDVPAAQLGAALASSRYQPQHRGGRLRRLGRRRGHRAHAPAGGQTHLSYIEGAAATLIRDLSRGPPWSWSPPPTWGPPPSWSGWSAVDIAPVIDVDDVDRMGLVVDAVDDPVAAPPRRT